MLDIQPRDAIPSPARTGDGDDVSPDELHILGEGEPVAARNERPLATVGWREWVGLPELGVPMLRAKVDTGARTSSLHAVDLRVETVEGVQWVDFVVPHDRLSGNDPVRCRVPVRDRRSVRNSGGRSEPRYVIEVTGVVGGTVLKMEITLASRTKMRFPMLLGRQALRQRFMVDCSGSYLMGHPRPTPRKGA